jgi:molybdopterin synthase catalytic subunit
VDWRPHVSAASEPKVSLTVRLFAVLRERAGSDSLELHLPAGATVADALETLARQGGLAEVLARTPVVMAVNREYADSDTILRPGDELALIPPVSGGGELRGTAVALVRVSSDPLSRERLRAAVSDPSAGAIVTFEGVTRDVERLHYEAYNEMAHERIERILQDCVNAHALCAIAAEHRTGDVPLGEPSVLVAASAPHRAEAFSAARQAIDRIKAEAPIWKRELTADSERGWAGGAVPAPAGPEPRLTHIGADGSARMVDVGAKPASERVARARARVRMSARSARAVQTGDGPKGEVLTTARIAGIQAAKQTAQLIPLAHPLALTFVDVSATVDVEAGLVELIGEARTVAGTGVEMEAMTACAVAALTVYDMVKGLERGVQVEQVVLVEKRGGRSGEYRREDG